MSEPTIEEVLQLVEFDRNEDGNLRVKKVCGDVYGDVQGNVWGSVFGNVKNNVWGDVCGDVVGSVEGSVWDNVNGTVRGKISGREWQFVETPKDRAVRLIREGRGEEAIKVLEEE